MRFKGKTAIVSGAAGDVGRGLCRALAAEGATVTGIDVAAEAGAALQRELRAENLRFSFGITDVGDPQAIAEFGSALGPVDILINNAAVLRYLPISETSLTDWDRIFAINLRSAFLLTKCVAPFLTDNSVILNMSSSVALRAGANTAAYAASKAGLIALSKVAAAELAPRTRVNAVCPGPLDTAMSRGVLKGHPQADQIMATVAEGTMVKRLGHADEIVRFCLFLASDEARFITGAALPIDGGVTA